MSASFLVRSAGTLISLVGIAEGARRHTGALEAAAAPGLKLPEQYDFMSGAQPPLLQVAVGDVPAPELGKDTIISLDVTPSGAFHLVKRTPGEPKDATSMAWANYANNVEKTGWGYLSLSTSSSPAAGSDDLKMYAAGFLEGFASAKQIKQFQYNADALIAKDEKNHHAIGNVRSLFEKQINTIRQKSGMDKPGISLSNDNAPQDLWWRHARYALVQAWGLMDAYNLHAQKVGGTNMSLVDVLILNSDGETPELEKAYDLEEVLLRKSEKGCKGDPDCVDGSNSSEDAVLLQRQERRSRRSGDLSLGIKRLRARVEAQRKEAMRNLNDKVWRKIKQSEGRCSALVRLTKDNKDLFVGHTTFSDYSEMNRIWKIYDLPVQGAASRKMSFSSYPGVMGSTDDYYIMDTGVVVTETTVSMLSDEPFDKLDDDGPFIPDYMRIMLSNRLSKTAKDWVGYMNSSATGTYSSQWMVVDYKNFQPGAKTIQNGTFLVLEQAPGTSEFRDMSEHLQRTGYWASENRANFKSTREAAGENEAEETHGNLFSADHNPRANIFAGSAPQVQSFADMRSEMQRNKWPHEIDGGPGNTPDHAIAARGDLVKDDDAAPNGGVDSKVTNACLVKKLSADAIAGPTHDGLPPFKWTDSHGKDRFPDYPHDGLPDVWNFDWVRMTPEGEISKLPSSDC